jgi:hypothetical protein
VGGIEVILVGMMEPSVRYHSREARILTHSREAGKKTVSGGQFDWGGRLLKGNGGAQRFPQNGWKSFVECKGIRELDCESDNSNRVETRP